MIVNYQMALAFDDIKISELKHYLVCYSFLIVTASECRLTYSAPSVAYI